eukprot:227695_1
MTESVLHSITLMLVNLIKDTAKTEELNQLAGFGELMARKVKTTMALDTYFVDGMEPFIKLLKDEQYETMNSILCDDEKEFNEIVVIIENNITKTNAENKAFNEGLDAKKEEEKVKRTKFAADIEANDNQIAGLQKTIGELKVKQMDVQLMVQMEEMRQLRVKQKTMKDEIKDIDKFLKAGPRKDIKPIRIKPKKGGPLFEELKKLCMLDFAESEKGWITKLEDDVELCEIPLSKYFKGKLAKWAEYLEEDCYESMEEILCDDDDEFDAIVATIEEGIARDGGKPMQQATPGSTTRVMRDLERLCMRDHAKVGWLRAQAQKEAIVGKQLSEISPFLATFFGEMQVAVTDARIILEYSAERTPAQQLAIKNAEENEKKLKAIEDEQDVERYGLNDELKAIEDEQDVVRKLPDQFAQNPYGLNDEQAFALDVTRKENAALVVAAVVKLHVVDALKPKFENSRKSRWLETGFTLACDIQQSSLQIFQIHAAIRSFLVIARQLIEFIKPAAPDPKAAQVWEVIDASIIKIFNQYIEMIKIADTYSSSLGRFKSAWQHFEAFREIQGDCIDVSAASIYLRRELKAFNATRTQMQASEDKLQQEAQTLLNDCLEKAQGGR